MGALIALFLCLGARAGASSATLLLEEPYGKLGFFTATGHAAVYLSGVCAETPVVLRPCKPGEAGVVLSRYDGVHGYDWIAIPLIPYLYAVERPEDVPLFAEAKMAFYLRDRYRRKHLEDIAPDANGGEAPGGNWYELIGSSYDRTIYGFEIETTLKQDAALIRKLNASPNRSHFHLVSRNCADFAKDILNFYYPKTLHRSLIADAGMTTPKQMAQLLVKFGNRHPELQFSRLLIAQVPGTMPRSSAAHGVVESFFKSKKYIVPSVLVSPIFAGCVAVVYVGSSSSGRFDPARNAMIFVPGHEPELPVGHEDRRAYQKELESLLAENHPEDPGIRADKAWGHLQSKARIELDDHRGPVLQMQVGPDLVDVGASAANVLSTGTPRPVLQLMLEGRLQNELRRSASSRVSGAELARDWRLLQHVIADPSVEARWTTPSSERAMEARGSLHSSGDRP